MPCSVLGKSSTRGWCDEVKGLLTPQSVLVCFIPQQFPKFYPFYLLVKNNVTPFLSIYGHTE